MSCCDDLKQEIARKDAEIESLKQQLLEIRGIVNNVIDSSKRFAEHQNQRKQEARSTFDMLHSQLQEGMNKMGLKVTILEYSHATTYEPPRVIFAEHLAQNPPKDAVVFVQRFVDQVRFTSVRVETILIQPKIDITITS